VLQRLRDWARALQREVLALWFACRDPATPRLARFAAVLVVAYALSPIDLIPDFIPLLGYLDELIVLPAAIWLILRFLPAPVLARARQQANAWMTQRRSRPRSKLGAGLVVAAWIGLAWLLWTWVATRAW